MLADVLKGGRVADDSLHFEFRQCSLFQPFRNKQLALRQAVDRVTGRRQARQRVGWLVGPEGTMIQAFTDRRRTETEKFILEMLERLDEADTTVENLKRALGNSRNIGAAVGVLMAFRKVSQDEAFEVLRRASQDQNRKLYAVAREVIATGELPSRGRR